MAIADHPENCLEFGTNDEQCVLFWFLKPHLPFQPFDGEAVFTKLEPDLLEKFDILR
ncbi:MAG: hypothetical protein MZV63_63345 [Marinilabiliales bacterium]|nr:hypothetical protein [Marinilabiliales bacterium]